jgi:AcrR family transcriptional regulator
MSAEPATTADPAASGCKPLRADARRNRAKIVDAAKSAFAELGLDAQMDDVAKRAGVGVGTLYRHFPTKDALVRALIESKMEKMAERGRHALAGDDHDDAWDRFATYCRACAYDQVSDLGLAQVISTQPSESFAQAATAAGLREIVEDLLAPAKAAGIVRADARMDDIPLIMCGMGAVLQSFGEEHARRYFELALDGLRNTAAPALPDAPLLPGAPE